MYSVGHVSRSWLLYWRSAMTFLQRAANGPVLVRPHLHAGIYAGRRTTSCLNPQSKKVLVLHTALHVSVVIAAKYNLSSNASKKRLLGSRPSTGSLMLGLLHEHKGTTSSRIRSIFQPQLRQSYSLLLSHSAATKPHATCTPATARMTATESIRRPTRSHPASMSLHTYLQSSPHMGNTPPSAMSGPPSTTSSNSCFDANSHALQT